MTVGRIAVKTPKLTECCRQCQTCTLLEHGNACISGSAFLNVSANSPLHATQVEARNQEERNGSQALPNAQIPERRSCFRWKALQEWKPVEQQHLELNALQLVPFNLFATLRLLRSPWLNGKLDQTTDT
ncbi:hypothetical protein M514_09590 [Trichuris suis]|uniref:Uncharacterized protein n=1 Tax=Trichuris suis TaxID=68888 RepID=A0A085N422_9BILA|nr:hypothetical protein M513_09590 [Trichuris suis]KFD64218.1 hypothetical protein M514_09590 [Trichuris suis]